MRVYLCTFATAEYAESAEVLRHSALTFGGFDGAFVYAESDLVEVKKRLPPGLVEKTRGYMLWSWKPYVILDAVRRVEDGDVVVYCDAAMIFTGSVRDRYMDLLARDDVLLFENRGRRNRDWCKRDCFVEMDCDETPFHDATQVNAAVQMYRKTYRSENFLEEYAAHCSNERAMDDIYRIPNYDGFVDHRHDQSVLTNLSVVHAPHVRRAPDPTQFGNGTLLEHHRQKLGRLVRTTVITPTIGSASLTRCLASVQAQTLMGVTHLVVVDGPEHAEAVEKQVAAFRHKKPIRVLVLPENTGGDGWYGHRVYAAMPHLINDQYIANLDEDNWYDPDHLFDLMRAVHEGELDWGYSLRKIYDAHGAFVARDNCESLGSLCHTVLGRDDFLVDTSCALLKTGVAVEVARQWYNKYAADRAFTKEILAKFPRHCAVPRHTVNYSASSSGTSVRPEFFLRGNEVAKYDFSARPTIYLFHFGAEATANFLATRFDAERSHALDEWQMGMLRDVARQYNLVDGFATKAMIPPGSTVFASLCAPDMLPLEIFRRSDLRRIGYTAESPNIRHRDQWTAAFLGTHFDTILTYWTPILDAFKGRAVFCPHNTHHLDFSNPLDEALLRTPPLPAEKISRSACMVLERRPGLSGKFSIDDRVLECLDPLREHYVRDLSDVTVYGIGWKGVPGVKIGHSLHRSRDPRSSVDIIAEYTFVVIVENSDADGYVSEKIYDAFIAGTIPIYYGNNNDRVGIPRDMYIDLRQFATSKDLDAHLRSMTDVEIYAMRQRILAGRRAVLERVSSKAFADAFDAAYHHHQ
jgi:glycosyltransferase involved in cell wall biosynthesis